ncbi:MAG: tRNA pseudouridine(55) synthase TruB [Gammaproteobacteria bacterium]|nr:tRNA pseudouridine(55) synthase TruB [Gammaproteobacteria bacterium]
MANNDTDTKPDSCVGRNVKKQPRRSYIQREINGIINIDKPYGLSSNQVLQKVRAIYQAKKAGHTGNLDPLATGVLPICLGHATKLSQLLLDSDKCYLAGVRLGISTTTGDKEGDFLGQEESTSHLKKKDIETALSTFKGKQQQMPPMYSALKYQGQPLYKLARQGIQVQRKSREIEIYDIELIKFNLPEIIIKVCCSKGTYIRTLAEDLGSYFHFGAHLSSLRRIKSGIFTDEKIYTIDQLNTFKQVSQSNDNQNQGVIEEKLDHLLLPMDSVILDYPKIILDDIQSEDIKYGRQTSINSDRCCTETDLTTEQLFESEAYIRMYWQNATFIGLALLKKRNSEFVLQPKRLFI